MTWAENCMCNFPPPFCYNIKTRRLGAEGNRRNPVVINKEVNLEGAIRGQNRT